MNYTLQSNPRKSAVPNERSEQSRKSVPYSVLHPWLISPNERSDHPPNPCKSVPSAKRDPYNPW
jgi:hypothetical protein